MVRVLFRGFLIDPDKREISEITTGGSLGEMYDLLTRPGQPRCDDINSVRLTSEGDTLWVDGEGFLKDDVPVFRLSNQMSRSLAGRGLVLGVDEMGENKSASEFIARLLRQGSVVVWTDKFSTGRLEETRTIAPGHIKVGDPILKGRVD